MKQILFIYTIFIFSIIFSSCYYDNEDTLYQYVQEECNTENVKYSTNIASIVATSCASSGCHDATTAASGIILETYEQVKRSVDAGGFLGSILHENGYAPMPLGGQFLPQCDIDQIQVWIDSGALDN